MTQWKRSLWGCEETWPGVGPVTPAHLQHHHFLPGRYVGELISDAEADVREDDSYLFDLDNKVGRRVPPPTPRRLLRPVSSGNLERAGLGCQWVGKLVGHEGG